MPLSQSQVEVLRAMLLDASISVFLAHGLTMVDDGDGDAPAAGPAAAGEQIAAAASFEGERIRGRLSLLAPYGSLLESHPLRGVRPLQERELRDWICEVVNQILGLLKARLGRRGLGFEQGLPSCLIGPGIGRVYAAQAGTLSVALRGRSGRATVQLRATLAPGAGLAESEAEPGWLEEGLLWA